MGSAPARSEGAASILLVGFMAAGKSEVARILARELGWSVFDVDRRIEEEAGASVGELFATRGEPWFREEESRITSRLLTRHNVIVAPGGGWAARPGRLATLPPHVLSVWLQVGAREAVKRGGIAPGTRPLLADGKATARLLRKREPYYREAELHLDTEALSPVQVARRIIDHLAKR